MKFARFSNLLHEISRFGSRNGFHSNFYYTNVIPSSTFMKLREGSTAELRHRIFPVWDRNISIVPILDQWVEEGQSVDEQGIKDIILRLRNSKRCHHALEMSKWMTDKRYIELSISDAAIRLQLISKAQGMEQAEAYFNNLSQKLKGLQVYCALLNCYATAQCVEKAEAVMQTMRDLGFGKKAREYNSMLNLYHKTGNMEKFAALLQEMEENGIAHDRFTIGIKLSAYAAVMDIEKMDKIVALIESDPKLVCGWTTYSAAATGFRKAGLLDKSFEMLKKAEACLTAKGYIVYNCLLTQHAILGRKDEVVRIWSLYKKKYKIYNLGYQSVLKSLVILGDIEMAEEIFDEWESQDLTYDIQIPNIIIRAFSSRGLFEKAEGVIDRAISNGAKPNAWTWHCLATGYLENDQPQKAVEMMKIAILICEPSWKPSSKSLATCLEHLKGVGDLEEIQDFIKLLLDKSIVSLDNSGKIVTCYSS